MTVYEENSAVDPNFATNQITTKTSVETFITVDDGAMVVLGGLIARRVRRQRVAACRCCQSIPILGNLFKSSNRDRATRADADAVPAPDRDARRRADA